MRRIGTDWRLWCSLLFITLVESAVALRLWEQPLAPWVGVYQHYAVFWALLLAAVIGMVILVRRRRVPWSILLIFSLCFAALPVALSLVWNQPYGFHDSWIHLALIDRGTLAPAENSYPLFHALVTVVSAFTGVTYDAALTRVTVIAVLLGVLFLFIAVRRHRADHAARQTAIVVMIPVVFSGFVARPFTLAIPFVLLFYWYLLAIVAGGHPEWRRTILGLFFAVLVYFHPVAAFMLLAVGGCAWLLSGSRGPLKRDRWDIHPYILLAIAIVLIAHLALTNDSGARIIESAFVGSEGGPTAETNQDAGILASAFGSLPKFLETLARSSYPLFIGTAVAASLIDEIRTRRFDPGTIVPAVASALAVVGFVPLTVLITTGVGLPRILAIIPILATPAIVVGLRSRGHGGHEIAVVALAVAIVLAGSLGAYQSRLIGGAEYSAGEQQVTAIDWMIEHDPIQIVGTQMTFWIVEGRYGLGPSTNLSATDANGKYTTSHRNASYSWNTSDREPNALYVVDDAERERARQVAIERSDTPVRCYRLFEREQDRIYQNEDTSIYLRTHNTTDDCIRTPNRFPAPNDSSLRSAGSIPRSGAAGSFSTP